MRLKYKWVKQENIKDCAVACLLSIIRMYGGNNSLEKLRILTKTTKMGTSAYHLIEAAKKLGFEAKGFKCRDLEHITVPCIAHVIIDKSYYHYLIIQKIDYFKKIIIINDPAIGIKKYTFDNFYKIWTRIIITLKPIRKIDHYNPNKKLIKWVITLIKPHTKGLSIILILSLLFILFNILNTFYLKIIADNINNSIPSLSYLFYFFTLITILKVSTDYLRNKLLIYINQKIDKTLINNTYKHIISLPYHYYNNRHTGDIIARLNDLYYVRELISKVSITFLVDFILVICALFILYFINNILFIISILIIIFYLIIVLIYNPIIKNDIRLSQEKRAEVTSYWIETISGINTIKGLNIENKIIEKATKKYNKLSEHNYHFDNIYNNQKNLKDLIIYGGFNFILFIGSILILKKEITFSDLILFNSLLLYFLEPIKNIFELEPLIKKAFSSLQRIGDLYEIDSDNFEGNKEIIDGDVILNNLTFSYDGINNILTNIKVKIKKGEKILLTGKSGSGKSTLVKLLLKYYSIDNNMIMLNNKDINDYNLRTIRDNICYVSQQEIIFTDSIYNNIVLNRKIDSTNFKKICDITYINEMISQKKIDLNFLLEENGSNLSGGERQRIMIARALVKKANIYIFDESMNQMNIDLERNIIKKIFNKLQDKTIIIISHRLTNKDLYDKIISLENKKIVVKERS